MGDDLDKVRYSHAGHDFHFLWTARRALSLLNLNSDLVAISIEGISSKDNASNEKGLLATDTAEYYGSEKLEDAKKVKYFQLKYSTVDSDKEWTAAEISPRKKGVVKGTIISFAINFKENLIKYGEDIVKSKLEYYFVTNRPVDPNIKTLLELNTKNQLYKVYPSFNKEVQKVYTRFFEDCSLEVTEFKMFLELLRFLDVESPRYTQKTQLALEINEFIPEFDTDVSVKLRELIHSRALPEHSGDPVIRRETIFHTLGITKIEDLLPAQAQFEILDNYIHREQENDIVKQIISSNSPIVIHASGGIGKSSFAQNLPLLMPKGSKTIVFDGFANGSYRAPRDQRHLHKNGLTQLINEFTIDGLCLPILPKNTSSDNYLKIFYDRLETVISYIQTNNSEALVVIILDAADNTEMASEENNCNSSFAKDLLQENPPDGCKIIALARTERLDILKLPHNILKIELCSFSEQETEQNLKNKFSDINKGELIEFHKLTFGNPRVQSYLLAHTKSITDTLKQLGQKGLSSDALIESQLEISLNLIKEQSHSKNEIDLLCQALSLLPPMVPIKILKIATGIDESLIMSFAADMGLALLIKDDNLQFRDEPVESWFRKKFQVTEEFYNTLVEKLFDYTKINAYVAMTMPRILYGAKKYELLYKSVYESATLSIEDPIQKQNIILENLTYAVKIAKQRDDISNLSKLLLEASKIISTKDRQYEFILQNSDLIATLEGPEFINDFLYRNNQSFNNGIVYANSALMLSIEPIFHAEARSFLRLTNEYLIEWVNFPENKRNEYRISENDIANIALAHLYLFDTNISIRELNRWVSKSMKFSAMRIMTRHLIEQNKENEIHKLLKIVSKNINLSCAILIELHKSKISVAKNIILNNIEILLRFKKLKKLNLIAVCTIAELAIVHKIEKELIINLLEKYLPKLDGYVYAPMQNEEDKRDILLRFVMLLKSLKSEEITIDDFIKDIKKDKIDNIKYVYNQLMPLYKLSADIQTKINNDSSKIIEEMKVKLNETPSNSWQYEQNYQYRDLPYTKAYICMDILVLCNEAKQYDIITQFLNSQKQSIPYSVWITLLKKIAFIDKKIALKFAELAYESIQSDKITSYTSGSYVELSRAVLPINREDSKEYFKLAIESNSTLGEDARDRVDALCNITRNIEPKDQNSELAYKFLKVSEMVYHFNDHKFPWYNVINSIANIDKPSSIAIISRLKDRDTASYYHTLSPLLHKLLGQKDISPQIFASMFILTKNDNWKLSDGIETIIELSSSKSDAKTAVDILIKDFYIEYNDRDDFYIKKIKTILDKHVMQNQMIEDLLILYKNEENKPDSTITVNKDDEINWNEIFLDSECLSIQDIEEAFKLFRKNTKYVSSSLFYEAMRLRVPEDKRIKHLKAFIDYVDTYFLFEELEIYSNQWTGIAVKKTIPKLIKDILKTKAYWIMGSFGLSKNLDICERLSKTPRKELVDILLENSLDNIGNYSYETILTIVDELSNYISSSECIDVLSFGIEQFQDDIEESDSDGMWRDELKPPDDISEAVGGFIYTYLGSTRAEDRWRAMHAVRRLCIFGEENILANLIKQLDSSYSTSFTDSSYKFYDMHAKLYLFISLARGVKENPDVLLKFADIFKYHALDSLPHVLIRKYCVEIAIELEGKFPNTYQADIFKKIKKSNSSPYPIGKTTSRERYKKQKELLLERKSRIHYDVDFEPYWFKSLSDVFNISVKDISQMLENLIIDEWGYDTDISHWNKDLRARHKIYGDRTTYHSQGQYPLEDNLDFYLTYHAMFCIAGELLKKYQVHYDSDYNENLWNEWLKRHILTREDGKWVSDKKDIMPIDLFRENTQERKEDNWEFSVNHDSFDRCLRFKEPNFKYLPVNANWKINNESVTINSTLVSDKNSNALLRALQTVNNPHDFYLAPYNDSLLVKNNECKMTGWITDESSTELRIDEFDPMAKISYPPKCPALNIQKLCKLTSDEEQKHWKDSNGSTVFISEVWGDHKEYVQYGERLQINYDSLINMLKVLNKDLLINIEIKRETSYSNDKKIYYSPYFKLYLFKKDGTVHELYKNYKIR